MLKNIKFAFLLFSSLLFFTSCSSEKQQKLPISGKVLNLTENYVVLSKIEDIQQKKTTLIDTLLVNELGEFHIEKFLESAIYILTFDHKKTIQLAYKKDQIILVKGNHLDSLKINGSQDTQLLLNYEEFRKESLNRLVNSVRNSIKTLKKENPNDNKIGALRELEVENYKKHLKELTNFIQENMGTSIAIYPTSIRWNVENITVYKEIVADFKIAHPDLTITQQLENRIDLLQKTAIGNVVKTLEMPSKDGVTIKLSDIKKTYTLVDFWASWCPPCRTESNLLNELYSTYNSKGFEIYGISLDSKKQRWLDALEKDQRHWANVSTVQGFKTPIAQEFGITSLPTNFLIDSEGKIIASNIHGKYLKDLVSTLFNH